MQSNELLSQLQADTRQLISFANFLQKEPPGLLIQNPSAGKWSVAQVIEHLNSYGCYYLPEIEKALLTNNTPPSIHFKSGWLGNYFTNLMLPGKEGKIANKMQSPKDHRPTNHAPVAEVLERFLIHQQQLLDLLEKARSKNIGMIRVPISLTRLIKLKCGDCFRFLIAHQQRHFYQIKNALTSMGNFSDKYPAIRLAA